MGIIDSEEFRGNVFRPGEEAEGENAEGDEREPFGAGDDECEVLHNQKPNRIGFLFLRSIYFATVFSMMFSALERMKYSESFQRWFATAF